MRGRHRGKPIHGTHRTRVPGWAKPDGLPKPIQTQLHNRLLLAARTYVLVRDGIDSRTALDTAIRDLERNAARWAIGLGLAGRAAAAR
jgi:hypothetical protein